MTEKRMAAIAKALSSEARCRTLRMLARRGEMTCTEIHKRLRLSQATTSHHLKTLCDAGLVRVRKEGLYHRVSVDRKALAAFGAALGAEAS